MGMDYSDVGPNVEADDTNSTRPRITRVVLVGESRVDRGKGKGRSWTMMKRLRTMTPRMMGLTEMILGTGRG